ncbi:antibiotic biosynthesis monooxygenase [Kaistia algarum]|uniref:putative quinol monooxygenase n=1 Tax=Kaistia algarum TaxID=2083279 RepID=UPI000CE78031|nr:antibiotic biosynthesis monooxygenase [Kaistia algarum]MCX5516275.1 antibiotic biosynthesis monooxygenase [Kaistia algarum]PPE78825.1 antibiotic biosynthesis monooxygenase [Kaistia algarum]
MPNITLLVDFEIIEGKDEELTALIAEHARLTLAEEPGCLRFDVVKPIERDGTPIAGRLMLTEVYENEAAVAIHEKNPRMPGLGAAMKPLLVSMNVKFGMIA